MPKKDQFVSETNIQDEKVYKPLLASIEDALRNEPAAAHAFAALREAGFDAKYMKGGHSAWKAIGGATKIYT